MYQAFQTLNLTSSSLVRCPTITSCSGSLQEITSCATSCCTWACLRSSSQFIHQSWRICSLIHMDTWLLELSMAPGCGISSGCARSSTGSLDIGSITGAIHSLSDISYVGKLSQSIPKAKSPIFRAAPPSLHSLHHYSARPCKPPLSTLMMPDHASGFPFIASWMVARTIIGTHSHSLGDLEAF